MKLNLKDNTAHIMGILNVTPDSFSDGGRYTHIDSALKRVETMINDGATIIDIGGESTRPGAKAISEHDELDRVIPIVEAIHDNFDVIVSVDTSKAAVMSESIKQGVGLINDVNALQAEGCVEVVAKSDIPVCIMHMQGSPRTMQLAPSYEDVINDIYRFFSDRIKQCEDAGIAKNRMIIDPGFGFGKTVEQNYQLLAQLDKFHQLNVPILSGTSRKSMIGNLLDRAVDDRLAGSLTTAIIALQKGAKIIRVHDVKETVDALKIVQLVEKLKTA